MGLGKLEVNASLLKMGCSFGVRMGIMFLCKCHDYVVLYNIV